MWLFCLLLANAIAAGDKARSTNQATWEAWAGGPQPGPAGCPRLAQSSSHEGDHCELTEVFLS